MVESGIKFIKNNFFAGRTFATQKLINGLDKWVHNILTLHTHPNLIILYRIIYLPTALNVGTEWFALHSPHQIASENMHRYYQLHAECR